MQARDGQERAADVDRLHQVVALGLGLLDRREADRAGVVDEDVDAAEALGGLLDGGGDGVGVADVADDRQRAPAGRSISSAAV